MGDRGRALPRWLPLLLLLLAAAALSLFVREFFRQVVLRPLLQLLLAAYAVYQALPQLLIWGALLLVVLLVATRLLWSRLPLQRAGGSGGGVEGRVEELARLIAAGEESDYDRWRLARTVEALLVEMLARERGQTAAAIRQQVAAGEIEPPPALRPLFAATAALPAYTDFLAERQANGRRPVPELAAVDPAATVAAAEAWLEQMREGR